MLMKTRMRSFLLLALWIFQLQEQARLCYCAAAAAAATSRRDTVAFSLSRSTRFRTTAFANNPSLFNGRKDSHHLDKYLIQQCKTTATSKTQYSKTRVESTALPNWTCLPTRTSSIASSSWSSTALDDAETRQKLQSAAILSSSSPLLQLLPIQVLLACMIPTCLGYYKSEYGVSYAYGLATSVSGYLILKNLLAYSSTSTIGTVLHRISCYQCGSLVFYGLRLCIFLYIRTKISKRMRDMNHRIEQRAKDRGSRIARTPFLVNCSLLYFGLCAPLLLSSGLVTKLVLSASTKTALKTSFPFQWYLISALKVLVALQWFGFALGAWGDVTKTFVKKVLEKNENFLVTSGVFSILRHPNYTGEMISWTCNSFVGLLTSMMTIFLLFATKTATTNSLALVGLYTILSLLGNVGIVFVLLQATKNLEYKQEQEYGFMTQDDDSDNPQFEKYIRWKQSTWGGFQMPTTKKSKSTTTSKNSNQ